MKPPSLKSLGHHALLAGIAGTTVFHMTRPANQAGEPATLNLNWKLKPRMDANGR